MGVPRVEISMPKLLDDLTQTHDLLIFLNEKIYDFWISSLHYRRRRVQLLRLKAHLPTGRKLTGKTRFRGRNVH